MNATTVNPPTGRLLVISASWPPDASGGAEYAMQSARRLAARGVDVHVLTRTDPPRMEHPALTLHPIMPDWSWRRLGQVKALVDALSPDAVMLHFLGRLYDHHPMVTMLPTVLKRRHERLRFVTLLETSEGVKRGKWGLLTHLGHQWMASRIGRRGLDKAYGTLLRDSDTVLTLAEAHRHMLQQRCPGLDGRCVVIPPPPLLTFTTHPSEVARSIGRRQLGLDEDELLLGHFGYIYPRRGLETLIEAMAQSKAAAADVPPYKLVIIGGSPARLLRATGRPDYLEELGELARKRGVADDIVWAGYIDGDSDALSNALHALDACVLPFENGVHLNNSSFAAAAWHGLPILTTQVPSTEAAFEHERNCLLCPPGNPAALAGDIERLVADAALRPRLAEGALTMAKTHFCWDRTIESMLTACGLDSAKPPAEPAETPSR